MLVTFENITKKFGEKTLFNEASFVINEKEKIGLIGVNGSGKSTLLKIILELETIDSGRIHKGNFKVEYLAQEPKLNLELTILEQTMRGVENTSSDTLEYEAKAILNKLKLTNHSAKLKQLSGGQKRRVALACSLLKKCDLLILDEPTNHLDNEMVVWLENYLQKYNKALLMITHDRYFLDRVTNKIIEIDEQKIYTYNSNYSEFLTTKAQREIDNASALRKLKSIYKKEAEWMAQGPKARGTKSVERKKRFEVLEKEIVTERKTDLEINSISSRLGSKTFEINNISKSFEGIELFKEFSYVPQRSERIGIVGKNGSGKSTLLNILAKKIEPDNGTVEVGETVKLGFFSQEIEDMDSELRIIDYVEKYGQQIETVDGLMSASQLLEKFLFPPKVQYNRIKYLSGGEKRRLYLLKVLIAKPNVLFLDEPTNDLDILTLTILEDYIENFNGIIITVSHDRYFLDKVVDKLFIFENNNEINIYNGSYSDCINIIEKEEVIVKKVTKEQRTKTNFTNKPKFSYNEKREFETIDDDILKLEEMINNIDKKIQTDSNNFTILNEHLKERELLEAKLDDMNERWFYLNDLNEKIENSK
jgi:ATP-binding cassette subfamily F protein uup